MPTARCYFSTSAVNGKIYAIGGVTGWGGATLSTVEEYDTGFTGQGIDIKHEFFT